MDLVNELVADHWEIRDYIKKLQEKGVTTVKRKALVKKLLPLVEQHAHGEEKVLDPFARKKRPLRKFAFEDTEEHRTLAFLIDGIKHARSPELLEARTHLFCELLEHHLDEEEEEYFPELRLVISSEESDSLALKYRFLVETHHHQRSRSSFLTWLAGRPQATDPAAGGLIL